MPDHCFKIMRENKQIRALAVAGWTVWKIAVRFKLTEPEIERIIATDSRPPKKRRGEPEEMERRTDLYVADVEAGREIQWEPRGPAWQDEPATVPLAKAGNRDPFIYLKSREG